MRRDDQIFVIRPSTRKRTKIWIVIAVAAMSVVAFAFQSQQKAADKSVSTATVTFTLDFPHSDPEHYTIAVDRNGHARYESVAVTTEGSDPEPYSSEFEVSAESRDKIFDLANQARYFAGHIDAGNRKLAFTGTKTLTYFDDRNNNTARYDYSNLAPVRELTALFQGMAGTLEYGRRLTYYHRYQKLALDDELKRMSAQARNNELIEIQSVTPVLREIADDNSVLNVVRARAKELMELNTGAVARHN